MKSNKETVYELIKRYSNSLTAQEPSGFSTQYLSEKLQMQRTNISSILNQLVHEGLIEKINGRPVLYKLKESVSFSGKEVSCFKSLIGVEASLKNPVQLAKAAILYPQQSLSTLIVGPSGSGKTYFAQLMRQFAVDNGILSASAPFVKMNCKHYVGQEERMDVELFGSGDNLLEQSRHGFLFVDAIHLLPASAKARLMEVVEHHQYVPLDGGAPVSTNVILVCACNDDVDNVILESLLQKFPIKIDLPALAERPMDERLQLIQHFFTMEAARTNRVLTINSEVLRNLLLYDCPQSIKQLRNDIQIGCANAYVREFASTSGTLNVFISDFNHYVRKGFLNYKTHRETLEQIIPENYSYAFSARDMAKTELVESELKQQSIYDRINTKMVELQDRGLPQSDIRRIVSVEMENAFKRYQTQLTKAVVNKDQLSKLVDPRIITHVEDFLNALAQTRNQPYPLSVFYGLSLHLDALLKRNTEKQVLNNAQISDVVATHKTEYAACLRFAETIESTFNVRLPIDEVVLMTLFLVDATPEETVSPKPVVLVVMHGSSTASSMAEVINALVKGENTYAYDLSLDKDPQVAYRELKQLMVSIDRGKGIVVLYDMGSIKTMVETIVAEVPLKVRLIHMPITLVGLDLARKATFEDKLDVVVDGVLESMRSYLSVVPQPVSAPLKPVLITLCSTGEGGAVHLKNYLMKTMGVADEDIIPLAISD